MAKRTLNIDLDSGRRAKSAEMEERLRRYMDLMDEEVKQEDVTYDSKLFFKTCSSFYLVTACSKVKATCSCPAYYQNMVCEHGALMDMLYDGLFHIQAKFVEECAEFRKRIGRRKGGQKEDEEATKTKDWDVIICGGCDDSDESDSMPRKEFHKFVDERVASLSGSEVSSAGDALNRAIIPTPTWRKIGR